MLLACAAQDCLQRADAVHACETASSTASTFHRDISYCALLFACHWTV